MTRRKPRNSTSNFSPAQVQGSGGGQALLTYRIDGQNITTRLRVFQAPGGPVSPLVEETGLSRRGGPGRTETVGRIIGNRVHNRW